MDKQEQMANAAIKRKMNFEDFDLVNAKLTDDGMSVLWKERNSSNVELSKIKEYMPHQDLIVSLDALKEYYYKRLGLNEGIDFARGKLRNTENLPIVEDLIKMEQLSIQDCKIGGVVYKGEGNTRRIAIMGSFQALQQGTISVMSPTITFSQDLFGFESEVDELCQKVKQQVYNYMFLGKCKPKENEAQLRIYDEAEKIAHQEAEEGLKKHREEQAAKNQPKEEPKKVDDSEKPLAEIIKEKAEKKAAEGKEPIKKATPKRKRTATPKKADV